MSFKFQIGTIVTLKKSVIQGSNILFAAGSRFYVANNIPNRVELRQVDSNDQQIPNGKILGGMDITLIKYFTNPSDFVDCLNYEVGEVLKVSKDFVLGGYKFEADSLAVIVDVKNNEVAVASLFSKKDIEVFNFSKSAIKDVFTKSTSVEGDCSLTTGWTLVTLDKKEQHPEYHLYLRGENKATLFLDINLGFQYDPNTLIDTKNEWELLLDNASKLCGDSTVKPILPLERHEIAAFVVEYIDSPIRNIVTLEQYLPHAISVHANEIIASTYC